MTETKAPLPVIGSRCWRDLISPESGATVLSFLVGNSDADPMVELAYDEGGSGWWPLSTLVFESLQWQIGPLAASGRSVRRG